MNLNKQQRKEIRRGIEQVKSKSKNKYTEDELALIGKMFLGDEDLLSILRKFFLQGELLEWEKILLQGLTEDTIAVVEKCFLPEVDPYAPRANDLWNGADMQQAMQKLLEYAYLDMEAQQLVIDYLKGQFEALRGRKNRISLKDLVFNRKKDKEQAFVELKARNMLLNHIDSHTEELRMTAIAIADDLSPEEKEKKIMMDSNK